MDIMFVPGFWVILVIIGVVMMLIGTRSKASDDPNLHPKWFGVKSTPESRQRWMDAHYGSAKHPFDTEL